jgi:hypothetical protein
MRNFNQEIEKIHKDFQRDMKIIGIWVICADLIVIIIGICLIFF